MSVPKAMQEKYDEIAALIEPFCKEKLNEEYQTVCLYALEKLCRKRPSPLNAGRVNTWAAGIVYAVGQVNFNFDKSLPVHVDRAEELSEPFGISKSTAASKAAEIRKMLNMERFGAEYMIPSRLSRHGSWLFF